MTLWWALFLLAVAAGILFQISKVAYMWGYYRGRLDQMDKQYNRVQRRLGHLKVVK